MKRRFFIFSAIILATSALSGCKIAASFKPIAKDQQELPTSLQAKMARLNMDKYAPILIRVFKEENRAEIWKQTKNGSYALLTTYKICKWSGKLGPKYMEGDRQAPEGFYNISAAQMNAHSNYYLAFNIGFPNAYDRSLGRTGSFLMVHGGCSSSGCYSMSDENIAQIYAFARDAFLGGQRAFQFQAFPFRLTAVNIARYRNDPNYAFWKMLKVGYDYFESTHIPPKINVCGKRYVFNASLKSRSPSPLKTCPSYTQTSLTSYKESYTTLTQFRLFYAPLSPSIQGPYEASLIAQWSRRRAMGLPVPETPPSL